MSATERPLRRDAERNRERILAAARELFTQRGLGVTLNDIAHAAGCGVGTVYRRFPDRDLLIDALFEERVAEIVALAERARGQEDPWMGLVTFIEENLTMQARDRALKELVLSRDDAHARVSTIRQQLEPLIAELVQRAKQAGSLREDIESQDMAIVQLMLGAVIDGSREISPDLWRRYLPIMLRGLRADASAPDALPEQPLDNEQLDVALRCWHAPR